MQSLKGEMELIKKEKYFSNERGFKMFSNLMENFLQVVKSYILNNGKFDMDAFLIEKSHHRGSNKREGIYMEFVKSQMFERFTDEFLKSSNKEIS